MKQQKQERLNELNALLNMDEKTENVIDSSGAEMDANMVAEDIVYGFRQKTESLFHEIDGQNADEAEQYLSKKKKIEEKPKRISIREKLKEKQAEVNRNSANKQPNIVHGKNSIDL